MSAAHYDVISYTLAAFSGSPDKDYALIIIRVMTE